MSEYRHNAVTEVGGEEGWPAYPLIMLLVLPPALSMGLPEMVEYWTAAAGSCRLEAFILTDSLILGPLAALVALVAAFSGALIVWVMPGLWLLVIMDSCLRMSAQPESKAVSSEIATRAMAFSLLAFVPGMLTLLGCSPIAGGVQ